MKIYCPKCHTCYAIEIGLIPADGKKMRCSRCGEVWLCHHKDINIEDSPEEDTLEQSQKKIKEEIPQNIIANEEDQLIATLPSESETNRDSEDKDSTDDEMTLIFSRLKNENTKISSEQENLSTFQKTYPKIKQLLGWNNYFIISAEIFTILLILGLYLLGNRYDIVRKYPQFETVFTQLGIPSRVIGEGLDFQNIVRTYDSEKDSKLLTVKGFIRNITNKKISLPIILANVLDNNAVKIYSETFKIEQKNIASNEKIAFSFQIKVPEQSKYVELTFTE